MRPALLPEMILNFREVIEVVPAIHVIRHCERSGASRHACVKAHSATRRESISALSSLELAAVQQTVSPDPLPHFFPFPLADFSARSVAAPSASEIHPYLESVS